MKDNTLATQLINAFNEKGIDILALKKEGIDPNWEWQGPTDESGECTKIKLIEADKSQLKTWQKHCQEMLDSKKDKKFGKSVLLKEAIEMQYRCLAELYLRESELAGLPKYEFYQSFCTLLSKPEYLEHFPEKDYDKIPVGNVIHIDPKYEKIPVSIMKQAATNRGSFHRRLIKFKFILQFGINPTKREIDEYLTVAGMDPMDVIKYNLNIAPGIELKRRRNGLSYTQFRAMYNLKVDPYYKLTTQQLQTLTEVVLPVLIGKLSAQVNKWNMLKDRLKKVIDLKYGSN